MRSCAAICLFALATTAGCAGDLDPPWQLDHDRIVAIRADPPRIEARGTTRLTVLLAHAGGATTVQSPDSIAVVSPASLATLPTPVVDAIVAPDDARLAAVRTELALAADAPVPLALEIQAGGFSAVTTVWLGESGAGPALDGLQIDGRWPEDVLEVPAGVDVPLAIDADDRDASVTWLTSCGTLHDFDLSRAVLRVAPEDPHDGELAVVVRDLRGGASWKVWPIHARTP